jgi:glycosyltransferase involved in cell wall biosynthesis
LPDFIRPLEGELPIRICRVVTVPLTFQTLFREQIEYLSNQGFDLTLISSPAPGLDEISRLLHLNCYPVNISRKPQIGHDIASLFNLQKLFLKERFDIVHSTTPKAGLLTAISGFLARIPVRIHTFTGQVWMGMNGMSRRIVRRCDWIISHLNTHCYADSFSQRIFLANEGLVDKSRISVLGPGSVGGVDLNRFNPEVFGGERARATRRELDISETALVILFVGRLTKDKGITELIEAFRNLQKEHGNLELILIGPLEPERDPLPDQTLSEISTNNKIHSLGFSAQPEKFMGAADVFCLPSYREGFGSVVIEAGAMALPTVASRVIGLVDAVVDGETGFLVPPKNIEALSAALAQFLSTPEMRQRMGKKARQRAIREFDSHVINQLVAQEYRKLAAGIN